jgi:two-component system, cell cycle sensor histidine kinase and response regulator CckA
MAERTSTDLLPGLFAPTRLPWESIMDSVRNGVVCLDDQSRVMYVNIAMEKIFGIRKSAIIGNPIRFSPELARAFAEAAAARQTGQPDAAQFRRDFMHESERSEPNPIRVTITEAQHGDLRIQIGVVRDLSNLRRMEEALVQSRKVQAVGALAGGLAHDFNNILTALLSQLDLALDTPDLPAPTREHIVHAQTSGRRAAELISRLQTFSRQTQTQTTTVDLAELIEQVVLILRRSIDRRIQLKTDALKPGEWLVKADASQVIQVVFNLCLNARDAMPNGGELHLGVKRVKRARPEAVVDAPPEKWIRLTVSDSGHGMSREVRERLFEPYFTTKTLGRGTGLGLSIAQSILAEQDGWIEAESEEGRGSRLHVFLPETKTSTEAGSAALHQFTSGETRALEGRESILIADDEEMVRLVLKAVLSYRGYKVVEATDGEHALELVRRAAPPFDLVLLDVDMPRLNGWETLKQLRAEQPELRVLMLSGGAVDADAPKARNRGAVGFVGKPFKNDQLVQLVRKTLDATGQPDGPKT